MASDPKKLWYYQAKSGERLGPIALGAHEVEWGYLTASSLVWKKGMSDWLRADETELRELFEDIEMPPPLPHERTKSEAFTASETEASLPKPPSENVRTAASEDNGWFISNTAGHVQGPLKTSHLYWSIKNGYLQRKSLVKAVGKQEWVPAENTELRSLFDGGDRPISSGGISSPSPAGASSNADLLSGYSGRHSKEPRDAQGQGVGQTGEVDWKNRWLTYALLTFLFAPLGILWGLIHATFYKKHGEWVPVPVWWKWILPGGAVLFFIPMINGGLSEISSAFGACDTSAMHADLLADMIDRRVPSSVMQDAVALQSRSNAHEMRGEFSESCAAMKQALALVRRY